jgi:4-amino-4-deoxy-L-arabinose transferase-like glycosyltransferase
MQLSPAWRGRILDIGISVLALTIFFCLAVTHIGFPGLYYDEALDVVPTMQMVLGQPVEVWAGGGISLGARTFPTMISSYVGTVNTYLMLPFFYFLGVSVFSLRFMTIFFGGFALVLCYLFAKDFLNRRAAAITVLLLAVHPSFVFWSRQGIYVTSVMTFMAIGSLFCLLQWHRGNRDFRFSIFDFRFGAGDGYLYVGVFLLGLGLSAKLLFLWFIIALAASYYILQFSSLSWRSSLSDLRAMLKRLLFNMNVRQLVLSLLSFCVGAGGLLWYNLKTGGTIQTLGGNLITTDRGVNNLDFFSNLLTEIKAFLVLIKGNWFSFYGGSFDNILYPVIFCVSVVGLVFLLFCSDKTRKPKTKAVFLLSMFALILVQSCFTVSGLGVTHLLIMLPLPQLIIALFIETLHQVIAPKMLASALMAMVVLALTAQDLRVDFRYHLALQTSGGTGRFSDATYQLAEYLEDNHITSPLAVDWGFKNNLQIITKGTINPVEIFQYTWNPGDQFSREVSKCLSDPHNLYLFHAEEFASFHRYDAFERLVRGANKAIQLERTFYQRDGTPVYHLYRVTTPGQAFSLWKEGEEYEASLGSAGEDFKEGASNAKCLGMGWGEEASHFALYRIQVAEDVPDASIYLRYAHPHDRVKLNIYLDDELIGTRPSVVLSGSGGWGYEESEWAIMGLLIGHLSPGEHWIKIQPDGNHNAINLDGFHIEGKAPEE